MRALFICILSFWYGYTLAQSPNPPKTSTIDVNYFYGNIANHNPDILHLITGHPEGLILSWNRKTFGHEAWQERFNYPDVGFSLSYQNLKNPALKKNVALYAHYNFYFLKRHIMFRIGQGIARAGNPYDKKENPRNVAFGSRFMSSTYAMLNFKKERLFNTPLGIQAGLALIHYSNANIKAPNTSMNSITANLGLVYTLNHYPELTYIHTPKDREKYKERLAYTIVLRSGINQSDVIGAPQKPFYIPSFYVDKRIGQLSALQLGAEVFFSNFLKEDIRYNSIAFPDRNIDPNTDYKRASIFVGHELFINSFSVVTQLGYYVYYPYEYEKRVYERVGLKRYFGNRIFASVSLRAHGAAAEAVEFGIGIRLRGKKK